MSVSKKPSRKKVNPNPTLETQISKVINQGGKPTTAPEDDAGLPPFVNMNLKIPRELWKRVNLIRESYPKPLNRKSPVMSGHDWCIKAIDSEVTREEAGAVEVEVQV